MANRKKRIQNEDEVFNDIISSPTSMAKQNKFKAKNQTQKEYSRLITEHEVIICSGPAGTGKSYVSLAIGLELVQDKTSKFRKLIICTPAVEADEKIGFLPGTINEKLEPYIASSLALIDKIVTKGVRERLMTQGIIEIQALGYLRGVNIDNTVLVCEESQNMTQNQMKTLLTRIGEDSKFIISGDLEQSDKYKSGKQSGLYDAMTRLRRVNEIGFFEFTNSDIVRNPIIGKILKYYNEPDRKLEDLHKKPTPLQSRIIKEGIGPVNGVGINEETGEVNFKHNLDITFPSKKTISKKEVFFKKLFTW
jgi:phosphate starvation-inducible PhoH-like protein